MLFRSASSPGTQWILIGGSYTSNGGAGGSGSQWLDGNWYAGGGSSGGTSRVIAGILPGIPGIGGGGTGANPQSLTPATTGSSPGAGGGGGGCDNATIRSGANGAAGVCIIRYPGTTQLIGGGIVSVSGSYVYHTFTASANLST